MKLLKSRRSKIITAAACGVALGLGGIASAYWTGSGGGTGTAAVSNTAPPVTIVGTGMESPTGALNVTLTPGGPALTPLGTINNANDVAVGTSPTHAPTVTALSVDAVHVAAGCVPADFVIGTGGLEYVEGTDTIAAHSSTSFASSSTVRMLNTPLNQDACKGATVTLTFALPAA